MYFPTPARARVVTACQQLLAVGVVAALLVPATAVLTLDVVHEDPALEEAATLASATVPTEDVEAVVTEVPLVAGDPEADETDADVPGAAPRTLGRTTPGGESGAGTEDEAAPESEAGTDESAADEAAVAGQVTSQPEPLDGFGAVGVTWESGQELEEDEITLKVRTRTGGEWSEWTEMEYHDEHAPDPSSPDAATARPGTEPIFVGEVDDVQVSVETEAGELPEGLSMALVEPGEADETAEETPEIAGPDADPSVATLPDAASGDAMTLQANNKANNTQANNTKKNVARPTIFSRSQWGADEKIRNKKSLSYGSISGGFVHHTVNANEYTQAQVPGIIRSIYAYHVKSRGWSDIGYNFLVDRFGRIWEGRYGGVDKPVVGAHTLNYNQYSFAMSAIGNFDVKQPSDAMLKAYGDLFAWKLSLHGVNPTSTKQKIGSRTFHAINGHRDAGSTACPGRYLYAKLPTIRTYAKNASGNSNAEVSQAKLSGNLAGSAFPDIVVRHRSNKRAYVIPTEGLTAFARRKVSHATAARGTERVFASPDLNRDGRVDLVTVDAAGKAHVRAGNADGTFASTTVVRGITAGHKALAAAGDLNGDGRNDLVGRKGRRLVTFKQNANGTFSRIQGKTGVGTYTTFIGPGDFNSDGRRDILGRDKAGRLWLHPGDGKGGFAARKAVPGDWARFTDLAAGGDYTGDGRDDLVGRTANGQLHVIPGTGAGTFDKARDTRTWLTKVRGITGAGNVTGTAANDIVGVRGAEVVTAVNRGTRELGTPIDTGIKLGEVNLIVNVGDLDGDGHGDFLVRGTGGKLRLFAGRGNGKFTGKGPVAKGFGKVTDLRPVGDVTGDQVPDLMGVNRDGRLTLWAGTKAAGFPGGVNGGVAVSGRAPVSAGLPGNLARYDRVFAIQDLRLGKIPDNLARDRTTGDLYVFNGTSGATSAPRLLGNVSAYDLIG
jgi:hypothetical protein